MKQYEIWQKEEIQTYVRRIKEAEENTDDMLGLRSDKLFWELQKERVEAEVDAYRKGMPTCECTENSIRFFRAMGIAPYDFPASVDEIAETPKYVEYKRALESMGYPEQSCERMTLPVIMSELGDFPKPSMQINSGKGCDLKKFMRHIQAAIFNIPVFYIDVPLNENDKPTLANLNYLADQIGEFIEWAESKFPGVVKYDKDLHIEALEMDAIGQKCREEIYQLIKHVPCPIGPLDGRRKLLIRFHPARYPNMKKGNEYLQILRDELGERVASGKGPYPEERLRLLWAGQVPQKKVLNVGKLFLERKIAVPFNVAGWLTVMIGLRCQHIGEMSEYGIKLSPLQEEARMYDTALFGGPGKRWVNSTLDVAHDIGAHGIIHHLTIGCIPMRSLGSMVAEKAEKELGIPTLNMEGRLQDRDFMSIERFEEILSPFIDKCFDWANKPRQ